MRLAVNAVWLITARDTTANSDGAPDPPFTATEGRPSGCRRAGYARSATQA